MKTFKHLFTLLLLLCATATMAHDFQVDGIYYRITNAANKTVAVTYKGSFYDEYSNEYAGYVVIPESVTYNGTAYSVTSIGERAFYGCSGLTSIEIPNSVTSIGNYAFSGTAWYNNQRDGVIYAGKFLYGYKGTVPKNLSIIIKEGTLGIADDAFYGNVYLTSIKIPNSVTSIGKSAFAYCSGLTSIVIGNSVTSIGDDAFCGCSGLTSIEIPNSVTSIGNYAFSGTAWYNNQPYGVIYAGKVLYGYKGTVPSNSSIIIKEGTLGIADYAFFDNNYLTSIVIPNSVTSIGICAFYGCSGLTSIEIPNSVTSIGNGAFYGCTGLTSIEIPNSVTSIANRAFRGCSGLTSIEIPNSVTSIGEYAFAHCSGLTSVEIPNSVTSIESSAFYGCSGLTSIEIPNSVTSIESYAFYGCTGLKTVINFSNLTFSKGSSNYGYIAYYADKVYNAPNGSIEGDFIFGKPNDVNTLLYYLGNATELTLPADYNGENYAIGANVFKDNTTITSVVIPNSVTSIGSSAFNGCTWLTSITIPNSVTSIGNYAFYGTAWYNNQPDGVIYAGKVLYEYKGTMPSNSSIIIKEGTLGIADYAFFDCSGLTSVEIPNSVTSIGNYTFSDCSGLTSIEIPNSVTSVGSSAFNGCTGLEKVCINDLATWCGIDFSSADANPLYYAKNLYLNGELLTELVVPDGVATIKNYAFNNCTNLVNVTIPNSVTSIESYAFYGCSGLTSIEIPNSVTSIGERAFEDCSNIETVINCSALEIVKGETSNGYAGYYANVVINAPGAESATIEGDLVFAVYDGVNTLIECLNTSVSKSEVVEFEDWTSTNTAAGSSISSHTYTIEAKKDDKLTFDWNVSSESNYDWLIVTINGTEILKKSGIYLGNYEYQFTNDGTYTMVVKYTKDASVSSGDDRGGISNISLFTTNVEFVTDIVLPDNYKGETYVIGAELFKNNSEIKSVTIPEGVTEIGDYAFSGCTGLTSIEIPNSVTRIGEYAFYCGYGLESVVIGSGVTTIGESAFESCNALTSIKSFISAENLFVPGNYAFYDVDKDACILYVPIGAEDTYASTSGWDEFTNLIEFKELYTVTFVVDGEVFASYSLKSGDEIPLPETPSREGYTFSGWSEYPATMPAYDITVEGSFSYITAIDGVESGVEKQEIYDLKGNRVVDIENLEQGIYIINGKKIWVK